MSIQNIIKTGLEGGKRRLPERWETDRTIRGYDVEGMIFLVPVFAFFVGISVFPIVYGLWLSLHSGTGAVSLDFVGLGNYVELVQDDLFWWTVSRGIIYAVYTVFLQLVIGVGVALALNKEMKFINLIRAFVFVPYMVPTVVVAALFTWLLQSQVGVVNWALMAVGFINDQVNFFGTSELLGIPMAMHSVVWASTWKWTIFVILLVLARLQSIDPVLYEAAKVNGAGLFRQFTDITLPQIKNVVLLVVLLRVIWQFSNFEMIFLLTGGGPFDLTRTVPIYAYNIGFTGNLDFGAAAAVTTMIFLVLFTFALVYFISFDPQEEVETRQ